MAQTGSSDPSSSHHGWPAHWGHQQKGKSEEASREFLVEPPVMTEMEVYLGLHTLIVRNGRQNDNVPQTSLTRKVRQ